MEEYKANLTSNKESDSDRGQQTEKDGQNPTPENVLAAMNTSSIQMNKALQQAWDTRPENEPELENQLLSILAASQKLEREIKAIIERQTKKDDLD